MAALTCLAACFLLFQCMSAQEQAPASISAASPKIAPPPSGYSFPDGQGYVYNTEWHMINAGTGTVRMESPAPRAKAGSPDPPSTERRVTATAESRGVVNVIFPVRDHFEAHFDSKTFCSLNVSKHTEEGSRSRETSIRFDYPAKKSVLSEKNLKTGEQKEVESDLPGCATDVITGFYYLQSLPLQVGSTYEFPISDGKTTVVRASVEKREHVKVPAGSFNAVQVTAEAVSGPLKSKGKVWVWYSDDANHVPVQMKAKLGWGTLTFRLQKIDKSTTGNSP